MKKRDTSPVHQDVLKRIKEDPEFAKVYFEDLAERPITVQVSVLRRLNGLSQEKVASRLRMKQAFVSKLEKEGSDHLISKIEKVARLLHSRLVLLPKGAHVVFQ